MKIKTLKTSIVFTLLLTITLLVSVGMTYIVSDFAYKQQRDVVLSASLTLVEPPQEALSVPSMVATPQRRDG